jgi:hypothetical protein
MMRKNRDRRRTWSLVMLLAQAANLVSTAFAVDPPKAAPKADERASDRPAPSEERLKLLPEQRKVLDRLVDKGLAFLASKQIQDGSFPTHAGAEPAVTSLCVMAFLSRGHRPGDVQYGECINRGIDYVLGVQDAATGAVFPRNIRQQALRGNYNHAISALMLCDAYSKMDFKYREDEGNGRRRDRVEEAIQKALVYAGREQRKQKRQAGARGGFRYLARVTQNDADLSVTAWMVMFYNAARKTGFEVPQNGMEDAIRFVHRAFDKKQKAFVYALSGDERYCSRATVGAGILCLLLAGESFSPAITQSAEWIRKNSFEPYNGSKHPEDRYHYSAFYCSQAMCLAGGAYFEDFYPKLLTTLSHHQHEDGSWEPEAQRGDDIYGNVYTTALVVLALSPPYKKLDSHRRSAIIGR